MKNPNPYFSEKFNIDNKSTYSGYGIDTYKNFLLDVIYKKNSGKILDQTKRATFESSLVSVGVSEAINKSLISGKVEIIDQIDKNNFQFKVLKSKKNLKKNDLINKKNFVECISLKKGISFNSIKSKKLGKKIKKNEFLNYSHIFNL